MNLQYVEIIDEMRSLLAYHQALGIENYPRDAAIVHFLDRTAEAAVGGQTLPQQKKVIPAVTPVVAVAVTETLQGIAVEIDGCCNCDLHVRRVAPVPGRGTPRARLLIVGGWLTETEPVDLPLEMIFGLEEDKMLSRMLAAIHLAPGDVFITNILKCGLSESCQPVAANINCCLAYLRRQIAVIAPKAICTMGIVATRALLDLPQSLSQLRGRFHLYTALDGKQIPLIPTYHPSYLLQAAEMKSEAWKDLQLIEKKLAGLLL
ncbi:MAG: uracil-DNA glycosylase [Deltaproteobacteria bacterium]|nr:uracil-DNA glycosylase [Deltaproteobacteria bacterium]